MRVLIVEDDPILQDSLTRAMRAAGYATDHAADGESALALLRAGGFDLVILDLGLPKLDGLQVLSRHRAAGNLTPVLILTARDGVEDRVKGLDLGADDYLTKPFELAELEARVRALVRRASNAGQPLVTCGGLVYDPQSRVASAGEERLDLTARELRLLEIFALRVGRLVSKSQIVDHLCEWGEEVSENAVEVYVHRLRKKIEPAGVRISTVRGLGYCLEARPDP